jgi:hypothetical protein
MGGKRKTRKSPSAKPQPHELAEQPKTAEIAQAPDASAETRQKESAVSFLPHIHGPEDYRRITMERLEHLYAIALRNADDNDIRALRVAVAIVMQQARMNGVEAPGKKAESGEGPRPSIAMLRELIDAAEERMKAEAKDARASGGDETGARGIAPSDPTPAHTHSAIGEQ